MEEEGSPQVAAIRNYKRKDRKEVKLDAKEVHSLIKEEVAKELDSAC